LTALTLVVLAVFLLSVLLPIQKMFWVFFIYLGFEGMFKIFSDYNPFIHVSADIYMGLLFIKAITLSLTKSGKVGKIPPLTGLFVLHIIWFVITFLNPYSLSLIASLAGMKMYASMLFLYFVGYAFTYTFKQARGYLTPWVLVVFLQSAFSLYQAYHGESSVTSLHPGYRFALAKYVGYAFRPFGFTALAGGPAVFIFLVNVFVIYLLFEVHQLKKQFFLLLLLIMSWITLFVCQVRSAIIKSMVGSAIYFFYYIRDSYSRKKGGLKVLIVPAVVVITLVYALNYISTTNDEMEMAMGRSFSAFDYGSVSSARVGILERMADIIKIAPFGAGMSRTGAAAGKFAQEIASDPYFKTGFFTDNFWLAVLVDLGIPGLLILTTLVFMILLKGFGSIRRFRIPQYRLLQIAILSCLCSSVFGFYGAESILYNPEAAFFWFFSGVMMKLPELDREAYQNHLVKGVDL